MKKILLFILCVASLHVNAQGLKFGVHAAQICCGIRLRTILRLMSQR